MQFISYVILINLCSPQKGFYCAIALKFADIPNLCPQGGSISSYFLEKLEFEGHAAEAAAKLALTQ